ncbi:MAG: SpoIIE family protein phosphatase, partial [Rikenellaceae bacterium]|nr:SpoIIE family protein phosphatase [Rikenellaceae bacterium]
MSQYNLYPDIVCKQQNCGRERICGDTFMMRRMAEGTLCVLSDGLGHGVKANVLSTLTASIIVNFDYHHQDIGSLAKLIIKSLPVCSVRKISYSTFTMLYFSHSDGKGTIIEFDNPQSFVFRDGRSLEPEWERMEVSVEGRKRPQVIMLARIDLRVGDRVVFVSDGVTQSGLGSDRYPFGWGRERVCAYVERVLSS